MSNRGERRAVEPRAHRRQRLPPADRRQQILEAAIAYFSEVGLAGGTRELARRLGVTQPLIYRYFPSKDDLIRAVYDEVYVNRWRAEWAAMLSDRSVTLRERLIAFYERYTAVIFAPEWIRIYLHAGLRDIGINRWWIGFVEDHVLRAICTELRAACGLPDAADTPIQPEEIELYWLFHGGIFYYGLRREVYKIRPRLPLSAFIAHSVDALLEGFPRTLAGIRHAKA